MSKPKGQFYRVANVDLLSPREFELLICDIFGRLYPGSTVRPTPQAGDMGVDVIVDTPDGRICVECKHYRAGRVGRPVVQKFHSALEYFNSTAGVIVTTGRFTEEAYSYARRLRRKFNVDIGLWDYDRLKREALRAGIVVTRSSELEWYTFNPGSTPVNERVAELLHRIECYPLLLPEVLKTELPDLTLSPFILYQYTVDKEFKTSTGRLIYHAHGSGHALATISNGRIVFNQLPEYFMDAELVPLEKAIPEADPSMLSAMGISTPNMVEKAAGLLKEAVANNYSRRVSYTDSTGRRVYEKYCIVKPKNVTIISAVRLAYQTWKMEFHIEKTGRTYWVEAAVRKDADPLITASNMPSNNPDELFLCNACGEILPKRELIRCKTCSATICRRDTLTIPNYLGSTKHCDICYQHLTGMNLTPYIPGEKRNRKAALKALAMSLIPGLGDIYLGKKRQGAAILTAGLALLLTGTLKLTPLIAIPAWIASIISTLREERRIKAEIENNRKMERLIKTSLLRRLPASRYHPRYIENMRVRLGLKPAAGRRWK